MVAMESLLPLQLSGEASAMLMMMGLPPLVLLGTINGTLHGIACDTTYARNSS